jgi:hypothetical protein
VAVRSTCDIARTLRSRDKPENVEILEYQSEMCRKIDRNIAGVQGVSRIRVQSVCGLINMNERAVNAAYLTDLSLQKQIVKRWAPDSSSTSISTTMFAPLFQCLRTNVSGS